MSNAKLSASFLSGLFIDFSTKFKAQTSHIFEFTTTIPPIRAKMNFLNEKVYDTR
jgi:hypothetical protein